MLAFYLSLIEKDSFQLKFEALYNKYYQLTLQYAKSLVHNQYDAEDICQEVWFDISQIIDTWDDANIVSEKAYIMISIRNKSLKFLHREKNRKKHIEEFSGYEIEQGQELYDSTIFSICSRETEEMIHKCLMAMDEIYRDVLNLYYFFGCSVKEIAKNMDTSEKTIFKRLSRGRAILLKILIAKGEIGNE